jgi:Putative MetA-pathway of phenol degradation
MQSSCRVLALLGIVELLVCCALAQDLAPRAYVNTPLHSNAITLSYSYFDGSINFNGAIPVTDAKGNYSISIASLYHSFGVFGHSANFVVAVPYAFGTFSGTLGSERQNQYRSGLTDSVYRLAVNLKGGPALAPKDFMKWKQKIIIGASIKVVAPTGQYDPTKLINWGTNRWSFKPEIGFSRRWGKWVLDAYGGVWFFTTNHDFWSRNAFNSGTNSQTLSPMGSFEGHLSHDFTRRLWVSLDGNFWRGGTAKVNGIENPITKQQNSRIGVTAALPMGKHQTMKISFSSGTYTLYGGDYKNVSVAWQYSWLGRPK